MQGWDLQNPSPRGRWVLFIVLSASTAWGSHTASRAARGPAGEVGGQAGGSHKIGSVSWLNWGEMFIPHLWASNEFQFKPHRARNP